MKIVMECCNNELDLGKQYDPWFNCPEREINCPFCGITNFWFFDEISENWGGWILTTNENY